MNTIKKVYDLTKQLVQIVEQEPEKEQRDEIIGTITALLEKREAILFDIKAPDSEEEKKMAQQIMRWNDIIATQLLLFKNNIQRDLVQQRKTNSLTTKYVDPYQNINTDGIFYDKRK